MTKTSIIVSINMKQTNGVDKTQDSNGNGEYDSTANSSGKFLQFNSIILIKIINKLSKHSS